MTINPEYPNFKAINQQLECVSPSYRDHETEYLEGRDAFDASYGKPQWIPFLCRSPKARPGSRLSRKKGGMT